MFHPLRYHSHRDWDTNDAIIFGVIIVIFIIASFFTGKAIVRRRLKKAPLRRLADFKHGETAKIVGTVECIDEPLVAPLSWRECSWYHVHVQQRQGKSNSTLIDTEHKCRFVLRDGNMVAYINDTYIKKYIVQDKKYHSGTFEDATARMEAFLKKHGKSSDGFLGFNRSLNYSEGVLEKGESVAVLGKGEWRDAETLGLPKEYGLVLSITQPSDDPVYLSDDIGAVTEHGKS